MEASRLRPCWLLMGAAVLLLAACTSTPAARSGQPPAAAVTTSPTTRAEAPPGSLANPRRLDCHNRNVWVPGEDKQPFRPGRADFTVGPLLIPGLRSWAHSRPDSYGHDHQFKVGVQVRKGQTATLVIPAAFQRVAGRTVRPAGPLGPDAGRGRPCGDLHRLHRPPHPL